MGDPKYISEDRVWVFTGEKDTVVVPGVVQKTDEYYQHWLSSDRLIFRTTVPAEHAWVTDFAGRNCSYLGDPYINNCGFDAAGSMLTHFYDQNFTRAKSFNSSNLMRFDQSAYVVSKTPSLISLGDTGYVYIPTACQSGNLTCKLHVVFHGCNQDLETIGTQFVEETGMNEYAEANNFVILYPQARRSKEVPYNPKGCFDWWGYTGIDYSCKTGSQVQTVARMLKDLTGSFA